MPGIETIFRRLVSGEIRGPLRVLFRLALTGPGLVYSLGVRLRNRRFDLGGDQVTRVDRPVISVGNITLGGTGKTPVVEWVARWYRDHGARVCLLSRGYGQTDHLNDEGLLLDQNLPDVPHLQDRDRVALARIAIEELESDLLILDDGFQHRRLGRDLDIVLLDALDPFGGGRIFPRGMLREPISSLRRAGVVVLSRADMIEPAERAEIRRQAEKHAGPLRWVEGRQAPVGLIDAEGQDLGLGPLQGSLCIAFCGLGNPEGFKRTLLALGVTLVDFKIFPDHHQYTRKDIEELTQWARERGPTLVLTTQKDSVKLRLDRIGGVPLLSLRIAFEPLSGTDQLEQALAGLWPDLTAAS